MVPKEKRAERTLPFFQVVLTRGTKSNATKISRGRRLDELRLNIVPIDSMPGKV